SPLQMEILSPPRALKRRDRNKFLQAGTGIKNQSRNGNAQKEFTAEPFTDGNSFSPQGVEEERRNWNRRKTSWTYLYILRVLLTWIAARW
ncbi:MAG: hypothetical protein NC306_07640, partial [Butyrivibrio sp.]|nr:hypothetical protein [Butyrivibrio sp.]